MKEIKKMIREEAKRRDSASKRPNEEKNRNSTEKMKNNWWET